MTEKIHFKLNHKSVKISEERDRMLLWVLRTRFGLTGAKYGCGEGFCGSCTVLVDDIAQRSCQYPISKLNGKHVITIEGLAPRNKLHPIQQAFIQHNAIQCGYCTPGMILNAYSLLKQTPEPTDKEIKQAMEGNLCRCSSYNRIVEAILTASRLMKGELS